MGGWPADVPLVFVAVDYPQEIKELRATMDSVRGVTDLDALQAQIKDLEAKASAPDLWDDPDAAQQVTSALSRANSERDRVVGMDARIDDLETLVEVAGEGRSHALPPRCAEPVHVAHSSVSSRRPPG